MFDLIGYWFAVTIFVLVCSAPVLMLLSVLLNIVLFEASRKRFSLKKEFKDKYFSNMSHYRFDEDFGVLLGCSIALGFFLLFFTALTYRVNNVSYIDHISNGCELVAPVFGWIGVIAGSFTILFFLSRKIFDFAYDVKDKFDKLG